MYEVNMRSYWIGWALPPVAGVLIRREDTQGEDVQVRTEVEIEVM